MLVGPLQPASPNILPPDLCYQRPLPYSTLMRDSSTEERLGPSQQPVRFFDLLRAVGYLALGGWLLYTANRPMAAGALLPLGYKTRLALGGVLFLYGIVRLLRALPFQFRKPRRNDFS